MPSSSSLIAFTALAFALIVIPGPSVMFVVSRAMTHGRRAALVTVVGNETGLLVQIALVAAGLGAVVERSLLVFNAMKFVGAAYLVWLGVQAIVHRRDLTRLDRTDPSAAVAPRTTLSTFLQGFTVGLANPKTIVFFAAILPQYVEPNGAPSGVQMLLLGLVFVAVALVCDSVWGLGAGTARQWFARSPRRIEALGAVGGAAVIGLGVNLALTGRSE